jgi:hypothetical protein
MRAAGVNMASAATMPKVPRVPDVPETAAERTQEVRRRRKQRPKDEADQEERFHRLALLRAAASAYCGMSADSTSLLSWIHGGRWESYSGDTMQWPGQG